MLPKTKLSRSRRCFGDGWHHRTLAARSCFILNKMLFELSGVFIFSAAFYRTTERVTSLPKPRWENSLCNGDVVHLKTAVGLKPRRVSVESGPPYLNVIYSPAISHITERLQPPPLPHPPNPHAWINNYNGSQMLAMRNPLCALEDVWNLPCSHSSKTTRLIMHFAAGNPKLHC